MGRENIILQKSFEFGLQTVKLFRELRKSGVERELCLQLLRCGTSIGANVEEAIGGSSKKDFIYKLAIAYREARETKYWLRLLRQSGLIEQSVAVAFINDCDELLRILSSILITSKQGKQVNPHS